MRDYAINYEGDEVAFWHKGKTFNFSLTAMYKQVTQMEKFREQVKDMSTLLIMSTQENPDIDHLDQIQLNILKEECIVQENYKLAAKIRNKLSSFNEKEEESGY